MEERIQTRLVLSFVSQGEIYRALLLQLCMWSRWQPTGISLLCVSLYNELYGTVFNSSKMDSILLAFCIEGIDKIYNNSKFHQL